jgi:hypothetical protein
MYLDPRVGSNPAAAQETEVGCIAWHLHSAAELDIGRSAVTEDSQNTYWTVLPNAGAYAVNAPSLVDDDRLIGSTG